MSDKNKNRQSFSRIPTILELPDLLDVQIRFFHEFLQPEVASGERENKGLQAVFNSIFPIVDSRENYILEFIEYFIDTPKYNVVECQERGVTFSVPLKSRLRLSSREEGDDPGYYSHSIEQDVYLGNLPYMTNRGTFIINGAERVIVSQIHRSPGVFFDESVHPNGTKIYSGRIIPFRGSWVEFTTDINDVMFVYIDRRKKFPVTTLLRALGYSSDYEILQMFGLVETVEVKKNGLHKFEGRQVIREIVNVETGEILAEKGATLTAETIILLNDQNVPEVSLLRVEQETYPEIILNTIKKDTSNTEEEALEIIYRQLRSGEAPDIDTARNLLERMFFNPKKYDLGKVGRYRLNKKLGLVIDENYTVLTIEDIITIIKYLLELRNGKRATDDIDHLGNRRVRTVGEQLATQFSVGLARMARTIKERMNLRDNENLTPQDLVNARTISSVINTFFGTSQLSQFMDQTNPLAELTHKRRLSALGPSGLSRERAGFEVRDVHYTHYGRLCPIETPEGPNIGLISSLCTYARVDKYGFLEAPYRRVDGEKVSDDIEYLSADDEDKFTIAQANAPLNEDSTFKNPRAKARAKGEYPLSLIDEVQYMDVIPHQIVSPAAALIPFLEHDDANRALMGSNMQRQSVPLLRPSSPIVGTGMEKVVARDSRTLIISPVHGKIVSVDANEIVIEKTPGQNENILESYTSFDDNTYIAIKLVKFFRTNQDTCVNQKPIVKTGDIVKPGDVLADGCATENGELALGQNVLVAFLPWSGYNFEDAIVISERVVQDDTYTSIHIEEFELQVRDTKRGEEELTKEIPNVSEEATKDLDENGIIRVGAEVKAGDIIVGKVTPKGETDPTPEEKLLKAIFGDKAGDVKDASLKAPPGMKGIVVSTKLFSRKNKEKGTRKDEKKIVEQIEKEFKRLAEKVTKLRDDKLRKILFDRKVKEIVDLDGEFILKEGTTLSEGILDNIDFNLVNFSYDLTDDPEVNSAVRTMILNYENKIKENDDDFKKEKYKVIVGDELPPGIVQLAKVYVAKKRKLSVGDKMAGRHGNKGVVARLVPQEDMPFLSDGTPVDIVLNPLGVPSRMNLGQIYETILGWAGVKLGKTYSTPVFDGATLEQVREELKMADLPRSGKVKLYDGRTGEEFDQEVTVGYIYVMKLAHLADDKLHARSIGPYSLITQQPLGGKAQFGGQRFGEMEVWALEAYGAAYTLQEILTFKSDDVNGRSKIYEAIVKGENLPEAGIPESFNVLIRELQGLCLDVKIEYN